MGSNTRGRKLATIACAAIIPLSLLCFWLVNVTRFPSNFAEKMLGPDPTPPQGSAPPYLEWDIRTMLLMLIACGASVLYLLVQLSTRLRRSTGR
jgi:hypothetical protein